MLLSHLPQLSRKQVLVGISGTPGLCKSALRSVNAHSQLGSVFHESGCSVNLRFLAPEYLEGLRDGYLLGA